MDWKFVNGYGERYKIYRNGDVFDGEEKINSIKHKTLQIPFVTLLRIGGHSNSHSVARLVYESFVEKIKDGNILKYLDGDTNNICLDNLEIRTKRNKLNGGIQIELDNTKEWKPIKNFEDLYKISNHGDVYSIRINKMMSSNLSGKGYYNIVLKKNGKQFKFLIHRLVYMSFKDCEIKKNYVIDHIDRIKTNNHINNLREVTLSENAKNVDIKVRTFFDKVLQYDLNNIFIKEWNSSKEIIELNPTWKKDSINHCCVGSRLTAYGYIWKYKDFVYDQTGYVDIKTDDNKTYSKYKIHTAGTVINNNGRKIYVRTLEYYYVKMISDCGKEKKFLLHRLIALTFIPNPSNYPIVNHIDENKLNNNIDNLEWTTAAGNTKHSLSKKVQQIDIITGKVITTFDSVTEAYQSVKKESSGNAWGIGRACAGKQETSMGFKWAFVE